MLGKYCTVFNAKTGEHKEIFVLANEGKTYHSLLLSDSDLLLDYVIHKVTGPILEGKLKTPEQTYDEVIALAEEGKRVLGTDSTIEKYFYVFQVNAENSLSVDYGKEDYWEVSEESSEDSYDYEEESE